MPGSFMPARARLLRPLCLGVGTGRWPKRAPPATAPEIAEGAEARGPEICGLDKGGELVCCVGLVSPPTDGLELLDERDAWNYLSKEVKGSTAIIFACMPAGSLLTAPEAEEELELGARAPRPLAA